MSILGDAARDLPGTIVVVAPHMDDELIGCGALLATGDVGSRTHVIYASDGSRSPTSPWPWNRTDRPALAKARRKEAAAGLEELGLPPEHSHFLDLPDGGLRSRRAELESRLLERLRTLEPAHVLVPFRYDFHPDHLTVSQAVQTLDQRGEIRAQVLEYFAYARWKLLPGRDIRKQIHDDALLRFDPDAEARARKRRAFEAHASQTSHYYSWQKRVNLTPEFVEAHCAESEFLVPSEPGEHPDAIFRTSPRWIRIVHSAEPRMKRAKDFVLDLIRG
jgi:LmbE family N-acetylglucosaminyl deacetylase